MTLIRIIASIASGTLLIAALLDIARHGALVLSDGTQVDSTTTMVFVLILAAIAWTCCDALVSK